MSELVAPPKQAPSRRPGHVIASWAAFVCAGLCFTSAGYLLTTVPSWRDLYESAGVALPLIIELQQSFPVGIPIFLIAVGAVFLVLARVPAPEHPALKLACGFSYPAAVVAVLFSLLMIFCNLLAFFEMSRSLQVDEDGTQIHELLPVVLPPPRAYVPEPDDVREIDEKTHQAGRGRVLADIVPVPKDGPLQWRVDPIRTNFHKDDWIRIISIEGPQANEQVVGGQYTVEVAWHLGSRPGAHLALYLTNGSIHYDRIEPAPRIERGEGTSSFSFRVEQTGLPHVYFYPTDGGPSFGDLYFDLSTTVLTYESLAVAPGRPLRLAHGVDGFGIALREALEQDKRVLLFCLGEPGDVFRDPRVLERIQRGYVVAVLDARKPGPDRELIRKRYGLEDLASALVLAPGGARLGGLHFESMNAQEILTFFDVVEGKHVPVEDAPGGEGKQADAGPRVDLPKVEVALRDLVKAIGMQVGQAIHVDPVIGETRLTVDLQDVPWRQAVEAVARAASCEVREKGQVLVLTRQLDPGPASYERGGGIVVLKSGQVFVGWLSADDEYVRVRWPYKDQTDQGSTSFKRAHVRWFSDQTDRLTDAYWAQHPTEPLQAIAKVPGAIAKAGETAAQRERAEQLLAEAQGALGRGDATAAERAMDQAAWNDPQAAPVWLAIGDAKLARRDLAGASSAYDLVIDLDRYSVPAYVGRSRARLGMKDYDGGLADAERAVMLGRNEPEPEALLLRGQTLEALGKAEAARYAYQLSEQEALKQNKGEWLGEAREGQERLRGEQ